MHHSESSNSDEQEDGGIDMEVIADDNIESDRDFENESNEVLTENLEDETMNDDQMRVLCENFFATERRQKFALPQPIMDYIIKYANHDILQKLYQACKYFFRKRLEPICYSLVESHEKTIYHKQKLCLFYKDVKQKLSKNTVVTTVLSIGLFSSRNFMAKEILPRLSRCDAKYIELWNQNFTFDELKFLVEHGNVVELFLLNCDVKEKVGGNIVELEKIVELLPKIEKLDLYPVKCNANTGKALANMKFNSKIDYLCLANINGEIFDANEFLKFCDTNRAKYFSLIMAFDFDESLVAEFVSVILDYSESDEDTKFQYYLN
uniref:Uncharacterized protein n=1 Tax=Panagrolaimus sp. ES5 TaxID=591445 RepID=A0AC34G1P8_9BILA